MENNSLSFIKSRLKNRQDTEHQQIYVRFTGGMIWLLFILWADTKYEVLPSVITIAYLYLVINSVIFIWALINPKISILRRLTAIILDAYCINLSMLFTGQIGAPLFAIYLTTIFGYGFRYGNTYLFINTIISLVSFSYIALNNTYWHSQPFLSASLLLTLFILPAYASTLVSQLNKAITAANAANKEKSQFLANMSHEIRTPLNGIIGMSSLLCNTELQTKQKEFANTINASAKILLSLINDILDISKIEAGKITVETTDFDLHSLVNSTTMILKHQAENKGVIFTIHISPNIPFLLRSDPQHLRQIIINLVSNAIKFTNEGSIGVYIKEVISENNNLRLRFEIIDTGIGIKEQEKSKLFNKFTQADESTTRMYGGTGLGMAIAKQLVETMNGEIGFTSTFGEGSTFWFELEFEQQEVLSEENNCLIEFSNYRTLIINPFKEKGQPIAEHLSLWSITYDFANHVEHAIKMINSANDSDNPYFIIFVFQKYLDTDPIKFITQAKSESSFKNHTFILINDEETPLSTKSNLLTSGYSLIIKSTPDRSTLFRIIHSANTNIVTSYSENDTDTLYAKELTDYQPKTEGLKILVVDDNEINQIVVKNILEYGNFSVTLASNGEEALDILEENEFDLLILDMQMPIMGGIEAAKIFRFMYPEKRNIPILILTANATKEAKDACEQAKLDAYLTKPIEPEKLLNIINSLIGNANDIELLNSTLNVVDINNLDNFSLINTKTFDTLFFMAHEENFMRNLIDRYISNALSNIEQLNLSINNKDYKKIPELAHALDGISRTIGAQKLAKIAEKLSNLSRTDNHSSLTEVFNSINSVFHETEQALITYLDKKESIVKNN